MNIHLMLVQNYVVSVYEQIQKLRLLQHPSSRSPLQAAAEALQYMDNLTRFLIRNMSVSADHQE